MFFNYFKVAFRILWHNKLYSLVNVLGLSIAMAVTILIVLYVSFVFSFDQFQADKELIYRPEILVNDSEWTSARLVATGAISGGRVRSYIDRARCKRITGNS